MSNWKCLFITSIFFLALFPLSVQGTSENDTSLEAREIQAVYNENETTTITWRNIDTDMYSLIDELKSSNYSVLRFDEPITISNYQNAEVIASGIPACKLDDSGDDCKGKNHQWHFPIPPDISGHYYYAITTTLSNGSTSQNLSFGNASLTNPVFEYGSPITSPYALSASFNSTNSKTSLSWIDISYVRPSFGTEHSTSIWKHSEPVTAENWNNLQKTKVIENLSPEIQSFEVSVPSLTNSSTFYTVLHVKDGVSDMRFLSNNTLTTPVIEDNIGSEIIGDLQISFSYENGITNLNWTDTVMENSNHSVEIWRTSNLELQNLDDGNSERITTVSATIHNYNYTVPNGTYGEFSYTLLAIDEYGNLQEDYASAPMNTVFENTISDYENMITNLTAYHENGKTYLSWDELENHPEAVYRIWRSEAGVIDVSSINQSTAILVNSVDSGEGNYTHVIPVGFTGNVWYAVTAVASFGTYNTTVHQLVTFEGRNAIDIPIVEDTAPPLSPTAFSATYLTNGTVKLSWTGVVGESSTSWELYSRNDGSTDEIESWELRRIVTNNGNTQHTIFLSSEAESGEIKSMQYAISGVDIFGNEISYTNWVKSVFIDEDKQFPEISLNIVDASGTIESSRWFNGGELSEFSGLKQGQYQINLQASETLASLSYRIDDDTNETFSQIENNIASLPFELNNQTLETKFVFKAIDMAGNEVVFSVTICHTCTHSSKQTETGDSGTEIDKENVATKSEKQNMSDDMILISALVAIILILLVMLIGRGKSQKDQSSKLTGLPTKSEDVWLAKYINKKN